MFRPLNSWLAYVQLGFQAVQAFVFICLIIDVLNTSNYLPLGWVLFGLLINFGLYLWTILARKGLVSYSSIMDMVNSEKAFNKPYQAKIICKLERLLKWYDDQATFFNNSIVYAFLCIFIGAWIGNSGGNIWYQPLAVVPTNTLISGYVIQKLFALMLVAMAAFNWRMMLNAQKTIAREGMYFLKRLDDKVDSLSMGVYDHALPPSPGNPAENTHNTYRLGNKGIHSSSRQEGKVIFSHYTGDITGNNAGWS